MQDKLVEDQLIIEADEELKKKAIELADEAEFGKRKLTGLPHKITYLIAFSMACFQLYTAFFG
ncbi:MAG: hypothetical protein WA151_21630, partial [Desulfatirhabdiaceae bacterium]